jgi:hypothetical protein
MPQQLKLPSCFLSLPWCCCLVRELGKVVPGKLVIITPDRQETFQVLGKQPAYIPPQASSLPSGGYLTATTASSRAKGGKLSGSSQHTLQAAPGTASADPQAQAAADHGVGTQQPIKKKNYLQQNIKAASRTAGSSPSSSGSSPKKAPSWSTR